VQFDKFREEKLGTMPVQFQPSLILKAAEGSKLARAARAALQVPWFRVTKPF
jgi:hypothetical protein